MKTLVCNHKMYLTHDEAIMLKEDMKSIDLKDIQFIVCPSYLNFDVFNNNTLGSQDAFYEDKGAYTGKISAYDLSLRGIKYAIVGHSDQRLYDTDEVINLKVRALLRNSMTPIFCIGETKIDSELRRTSEVLKRQIIKGLKDVKLDTNQEIIVAYEPRFLIGSKKTLSKEDIEDTLKYIRKILESINITNYKLLYGAGINSKNINLIKSNMCDGYLLGSSSCDINELKIIVNSVKKV